LATGSLASLALSAICISLGSPAVGEAITGALPVKVVACFVPAPVFALVARPEIKSVQELKDKTVGISTFSGLSIFGARVIAKHFGLDPDKDVKFIPGGSSEGRLIRMQQGLLDATMASVPADYLGRKMGFPVIVRSEDLFTYPFSGSSTTPNAL
jgi:ABC-type nitrate/sulfonate/bicarbonate transport system substrate-binding protein